MARTTLTKTNAGGNFPVVPLTADSADITMTAADVANGNQFVPTGNELVIAHNSGASPYTVTITSVAAGNNRTGDIATYSLAAGDYAVFGPFRREGWLQSDGYIYLSASNASVTFGIITLPQ